MNKMLIALALSASLLSGCNARGKVGLAVGDNAPDFSITTSDGTSLSLSSFRGSVLLITSAATWCGTCVIEAEELRKAYTALPSNRVIFLTVSIDPREDVQTLESFRASAQTPWFYATKAGASDLVRSYGLDRFEITYIIDPSGVIRYQDRRITTAEEALAVLTPLTT